MDLHEQAAVVAAGVLGLVAVFQLALSAGAPLGLAAWGGRHRVLPTRLRVGSAAAAAVLCLAAWVVLVRVGLLGPGEASLPIRLATWVFAAMFGLNTLGNAASTSRVERRVMTPVTVLLCVCFGVAALG
jgi:hypothetical protein